MKTRVGQVLRHIASHIYCDGRNLANQNALLMIMSAGTDGIGRVVATSAFLPDYIKESNTGRRNITGILTCSGKVYSKKKVSSRLSCG